ncbi:DUF4245 domain-containing protein [Nesterenkonia alba]|uniref:DUF4245 domain-containing protein n=1 Tax=Nesterenkonia alba TaxID=515814 RepID=UPI0003B6E10A|nr:DUF4245 domain-containing protein [Nesterenkonia alba]
MTDRPTETPDTPQTDPAQTENAEVASRPTPTQNTAPQGDSAAQQATDGPAEDEQPKVQLTESQAKRLTTPMMGMILTMAVLTGLLAVLWFMNPEPDVQFQRDEDVHEAAVWTASAAEFAPIAPDVPEGWTANYARWETRAEFGVDVWEVGYTTEAVDFIGFAQTDEANPAWVNEETEQAPTTGSATIEGLQFETREQDGRRYYVLEAEENSIDGTTVVVRGDAEDGEFDQAMEAIIAAIGEEIEHDEP